MGKTLAAVQSSYIPWKGYFDLINMADEFVLYDDVQYVKKTWRNRNQIKTPHGLLWLTIPVKTHNRFEQAIKDTHISSPLWGTKHWKSLQSSYARARYFQNYRDIFETLYAELADEKLLSQVNYKFITQICHIIGIHTRLTRVMDYELQETDKTRRVIELCQKAEATKFVSGPTARAYMDAEQFKAAGIDLEFVDFSVYPEYEQLYPPFEHHVSILDLVFNAGSEASQYMLSFSHKPM